MSNLQVKVLIHETNKVMHKPLGDFLMSETHESMCFIKSSSRSSFCGRMMVEDRDFTVLNLV